MSAITVETLARTAQRASARMATLEAELNAADSLLGDGDTGVMLARVLSRLAETDLSASQDLGQAFQAFARTAAGATGSSLGTLLATALLTIGKAAKGTETADWDRLSAWLSQALDAMIQRGGANLGDKTVLDALDAVARATEGLTDPAAVSTAARTAAEAALAAFRDRPCKIGRARMFAEKSIGIDDPGMLGFVRLVGALSAQG